MKCVLVANQDPALGNLIGRYLGQEYKTSVVSNAYAIFDELKVNHDISAIVIDSNLNLIDAEDIVKNLKLSGFYYLIPILVIHRAGDVPEGEVFRFSGVDLLSKPFDPVELRLRIEQLTSMKIVD